MKNNIKLIHEVRAVKNREEIKNIITAQRISERVLGDVLKILKVGITEIEVEHFIKKSFVKYLSKETRKTPILAFPPIISFGKNTANIHHMPSKTKLKKGDFTMFDFGCTVNHYCSDMTRTFIFGESNKKQRQKQEKIYKAVLYAQNLALTKIQNGERRGNMIDRSARNFLKKKFHANKFAHGLGHGVGTVIHEWPNFKAKSTDIIPTGCVMTVEPGIYIKNFGGVRIEDMVLITKNSSINLTKAPKELEDIVLPVVK